MAVGVTSLPNCFDENDEICPLCGTGSLHEHDRQLKRAQPRLKSADFTAGTAES